MIAKIKPDKDRLADFCKRHNIVKLAFFGSVLSERFGPDSDVDILVEFDPDVPVGLIAMGGIQLEMERLLGRKVDLRTPEDLSRYFRQEVLARAEVHYAEGR